MPNHKRTSSQSIDNTNTIIKRPKRVIPNSSTSKSKAIPSLDLIERINALPLSKFSYTYFPHQSASRTLISHSSDTDANAANMHITLTSWTEMSPSLRSSCINLIESTSSDHYRASETGWSRAKKLKEMSHPAMKYLLLLLPPTSSSQGEQEQSEDEELQAFLSFMITEEDRHVVIYCYELHLLPSLQGKGIGGRMMGLMEMVGDKVGVEKAMLTVFRSNSRAVEAYRKWGYGVDEFSPEPRRLRDGTVKMPSYVILSKRRGEFAKEGEEEE